MELLEDIVIKECSEKPKSKCAVRRKRDKIEHTGQQLSPEGHELDNREIWS